MAWATAGSRSGMGGYELQDHLSEQFFRPAGRYFANLSSSVGNISEEVYSRQAVYSSYTLRWRYRRGPELGEGVSEGQNGRHSETGREME